MDTLWLIYCIFYCFNYLEICAGQIVYFILIVSLEKGARSDSPGVCLSVQDDAGLSNVVCEHGMFSWVGHH